MAAFGANGLPGAERRAVTLIDELAKNDAGAASNVSSQLLIYLNRLSDLLFVLARAVNHASGSGDIEWQKPGSK